MLRFLFPRLTPAEPRGAKLFGSIVSEARRPVWYRDFGVPDTLDGRFSVLATLTALVTIRLEDGGEEAKAAAVALSERFIEAMDAEHRQIGFGDPTLGKIVRKLVSRLAKRVELWRSAVEAGDGWNSATKQSLDGSSPPEGAERLQAFWSRLLMASDKDLIAGRLA